MPGLLKLFFGGIASRATIVALTRAELGQHQQRLTTYQRALWCATTRRTRVPFPSGRRIRLARRSTGRRCGLTNEFSAPGWLYRISTHGRLTS